MPATEEQHEVFRRTHTRALAAARRGWGLDRIDEEVIERAEGLDDESRAAIWLAAHHEIEFHQHVYAARQAAAFAHPEPVPGTD